MSNDIIGKSIGNYEVLRRIGKGGMGVVYEALDTSLNRRVALKILPDHLSDDEDFEIRFQREARAAAQLWHPNVVAIHSIGEHEGCQYIVMEFVKGHTVSQLIKMRGKIPVAEAMGIAKQAASALAAAHKAEIVHRDVKPQNIMVDYGGRVKVLDFGIAKLVGPSAEKQLTRTGIIMGTPEYMSPEQIQNHPLDGRADLYSLGIVLYHMIAGKPPFVGKTPVHVGLNILGEPAPPIREANPEAPAVLERLFEYMLAKDREDRYSTGEELESVIDCYLLNGEIPAPESQDATARIPAQAIEEPDADGTEDDEEGEEGSTAHFEAIEDPAPPDAPEHREGWTRNDTVLAGAAPAVLKDSALGSEMPEDGAPPTETAVGGLQLTPRLIAILATVVIGSMLFGMLLLWGLTRGGDENEIGAATDEPRNEAQTRTRVEEPRMATHEEAEPREPPRAREEADEEPAARRTVALAVEPESTDTETEESIASAEPAEDSASEKEIEPERELDRTETEIEAIAAEPEETPSGESSSESNQQDPENEAPARADEPEQFEPSPRAQAEIEVAPTERSEPAGVETDGADEPAISSGEGKPESPADRQRAILPPPEPKPEPEPMEEIEEAPAPPAEAKETAAEAAPAPEPTEPSGSADPARQVVPPDPPDPAEDYVETAFGTELEMVWIEGGSYDRGAYATEANAKETEMPIQGITLEGFWMGAFEVTEAQWELIMGSDRARIAGGPRHPVRNVSWNDATEFCELLSESAGRAYSLPTEAQWEYVARAGTNTLYGGIDNSPPHPRQSNYGESLNNAPVDVDRFEPNAWGVHQMIGNVQEWCSDWYGPLYYKNSPGFDPPGPDSSIVSRRVVRGGSFMTGVDGLRVTRRYNERPREHDKAIGFRVVRRP